MTNTITDDYTKYKRRYDNIDNRRIKTDLEYQLITAHQIIPPDVLAADDICLKKRHAGYLHMSSFEATDLFVSEYINAYRQQHRYHNKYSKGKNLNTNCNRHG